MDKILLQVLTGSRLYNLHTDDSDYDYRGVYLEPLESILGLSKAESKRIPGRDESDTMWALKHFVSLMVKNNPNILELIYAPNQYMIKRDYLFTKYFIDNRDLFLSKNCINAFVGYSRHQMKLVKNNSRPQYSAAGEYDKKAAMHVFRLMHQAEQILETHTLNPFIEKDTSIHTFLIKLRNMDMFNSYEALEEKFNEEYRKLQEMEKESSLRDKVDTDFVNELLIDFYEEVYFE